MIDLKSYQNVQEIGNKIYNQNYILPQDGASNLKDFFQAQEFISMYLGLNFDSLFNQSLSCFYLRNYNHFETRNGNIYLRPSMMSQFEFNTQSTLLESDFHITYHGTDANNVKSIIQQGFRITNEQAHGRVLGDGIYTTKCSLMAEKYSKQTFWKQNYYQCIFLIHQSNESILQAKKSKPSIGVSFNNLFENKVNENQHQYCTTKIDQDNFFIRGLLIQVTDYEIKNRHENDNYFSSVSWLNNNYIDNPLQDYENTDYSREFSEGYQFGSEDLMKISDYKSSLLFIQEYAQIDLKNFSMQHNCYYNRNYNHFQQRGSDYYLRPSLCSKFILQTALPKFNDESMMYNYHGTHPKNLQSILEYGIQKPQTRLPNGEIVEAKNGYSRGQGIYSSQLPPYAQLNSDVVEYQGKFFQSILIFRQFKNDLLNYSQEKQTDRFDIKKLHKLFRGKVGENQIKYLSKKYDKKNLILHRILIQVHEMDPHQKGGEYQLIERLMGD